MFFLNKNKFITCVICLTIFLLFFLVEMNTPFHSDDFWYYQIGNSLSNHINHYLTWSGRVVSDYASTIVLHLNHYIVSIFIAILGTLTCFLIADLPSKLLNLPFSNSRFVFLTCLYWLSHPDIGEGVFWVVGACNYLFTTCIVLSFLYLFVLLKNSSCKINLAFLFCMSVFAGCSNENTSVSVFLVLSLFLFYFYSHNIEFNRKLVVLVFFGLVIGASVLILSPGNFARLSNPLYESWRTLPVYEKFFVHVVRFRKTFNYVFIILMFVLATVVYKNRAKKIYRDNIQLSLFFIATSLVAYFILFISPSMPRRAFTSIYIYQLLALSCILYPIDLNKYLNIFSKFFFCFVVMSFCLSYSYILNSYSVTKIQESIRNEHICYEKLVNNSKVEIPSYYFVKLLRNRDDFDPLQSSAHSSYVNVKELEVKKVDCDYSIIKDKCNRISIVNKTDLPISAAFYKASSFFRNASQLLVESGEAFPDNFSVSYVDAEDSGLKRICFSNYFRIKDKYYAGVSGDINNVLSIIIE